MNEVYTTPATGTPLDRMGPYGPSGFFERGLLMEAKLFGELMRARTRAFREYAERMARLKEERAHSQK